MDRAKLVQMSVDELWTLHLEISDALLLLEERLNQVRAPSVRARAVPSVLTQNTAILITSIASSDEADTVHSRTSYFSQRYEEGSQPADIPPLRLRFCLCRRNHALASPCVR